MVEKYGYTALKMGIQAPGDMPYNQAIRLTVEHVAAVREAVGPDVDIGVDIHTKFFEVDSAPSAWRTRSSRTIRCGWKSRSARKTTTR